MPIKRQNFNEPITKTHKMLEAIHADTQPPTLLTSSGLGGKIPLANANNLAYTGPVFLGTPLQGSATSEFVYDTGSGFLTVNSKDCSTCTSKYYDS